MNPKTLRAVSQRRHSDRDMLLRKVATWEEFTTRIRRRGFSLVLFTAEWMSDILQQDLRQTIGAMSDMYPNVLFLEAGSLSTR